MVEAQEKPYPIRLPPEVKKYYESRAKLLNRSFHAEILGTLQNVMHNDPRYPVRGLAQ